MTEELRKCTKCGLEKPKTRQYFYYITKANKNDPTVKYLAHECIGCAKIRATTGFRKNRFGISNQQFIEMVAKQNGVCAICGKPDKVVLCIDHDHTTGAIRQLLCRLCNMGIGSFQDSPDLLRKAADYLEENKNAGYQKHSDSQRQDTHT